MHVSTRRSLIRIALPRDNMDPQVPRKCSDRIVQLPLVPYGKNTDQIPRRDKAIKSDVSRLSVGDDKLTQIAFNAPADQWMVAQYFDRLAYRAGRSNSGSRILFGEKLERSLQIGECILRIDYLRQGFGRVAVRLRACRSSQR